MTKRTLLSLTAIAALGAAPANAGEITGNGKSLKPLQGASACAFSGINDTPEGLIIIIDGTPVQVDPGGHTQSYGSFMTMGFLPHPSDPDSREGELSGFPGASCNPTGGFEE